MTVSQKTSFIRVFEVWTPDSSYELLHLNGALYGGLDEFEKVSNKTVFAQGEGLPGLAWRKQKPIIFRTFDPKVFLRTEAAHAAGLTTGVAIPFFTGERLNAVLVMLCGEQKSAPGAIEIWEDDKISGMSWVDGYYGDMAKFERISKLIKFPSGVGLPGLTWKNETPYIIGNLANTNAFIRAANARDAGINSGIGIPVYTPRNRYGLQSIVTFLSAKDAPIARRFEVWGAKKEADRLCFISGYDQDSDELEPANESRQIALGQGIIGIAWREGIPILQEAPKDSPVQSIIAIPIRRLNGTYTVAAFYQ